ncbi:hypothetical protein FIA58_013195 [Flavobacterium jejuense]|uniref:MORN repeat variant n=1 Tax=Flavobacterium jejuense TaxID=1544455 RepID=A0ABX0IU07_9FLAO|nr:hypothetical protein [Flavobacterium jejuense]NHN26635.1 hypothetical protein [Flavobacterium jejuense]
MRKYLFFYAFLLTLSINSQNTTMNRDYQYDQEILNESGQRHGTLVQTSYIYDSLAYSHIYDNGELVVTTDYRFQIEDKKELVGKYKDDLPYDGYFVYENEYEIAEIDYYEKGVFQFKYTTTIIEMMKPEMTGMKPKMIKNIYKEEQLWQGLNHKSFKMDGSNLLVTEYYENGAITNVDLWILAMHYAQLIKIKFLPNGYTIYTDPIIDPEGDPEVDRRAASILVQFTDINDGKVSFSIDNKVIAKYQFSNQNISSKIDWMKKIMIYSLSDNDTILLTNKFNFEGDDRFEKEYSYSNKNIMLGFYTNLIYKPIPMLTPKNDNDYLKIFDFKEETIENRILIINEEGKPFMGTFIQKEGTTYTFSKYENYKVVVTKDNLSFKAIKELLFKE